MAFLARLNHTQRAVRWSAWKWTSLILAALVVGTIGALATYALGWRHTAQDTEMAAARAKAISIVRTRARNACDVSLSQSDLDECVQGVRATDFTAKALMAPKQPDAVRLVREGEGVWLVLVLGRRRTRSSRKTCLRKGGRCQESGRRVLVEAGPVARSRSSTERGGSLAGAAAVVGLGLSSPLRAEPATSQTRSRSGGGPSPC